MRLQLRLHSRWKNQNDHDSRFFPVIQYKGASVSSIIRWIRTWLRQKRPYVMPLLINTSRDPLPYSIVTKQGTLHAGTRPIFYVSSTLPLFVYLVGRRLLARYEGERCLLVFCVQQNCHGWLVKPAPRRSGLDRSLRWLVQAKITRNELEKMLKVSLE